MLSPSINKVFTYLLTYLLANDIKVISFVRQKLDFLEDVYLSLMVP